MGVISIARCVEESQWTKEQALAWAAAASKWPTRRFQLQTKIAGNSRLVTEEMGRTLQRQRGGNLVEMIAKNREAAGLPSRRKKKWAELPACEKCKAAASKPCRTSSGALVKKPHACRLAKPPAADPATAPSA